LRTGEQGDCDYCESESFLGKHDSSSTHFDLKKKESGKLALPFTVAGRDLECLIKTDHHFRAEDRPQPGL
jgi:hypothetical protein